MADLYLDGTLIFGAGLSAEVIAAAALNDLPTGFISGFQLTWIDADTIEISSGLARDFLDVANIIDELSTAQVQLSVDLDTGSEAADTWYAIHVIGDSDGVNPVDFLFSLSEDNPTLPVGYDSFRRIGWVRNDPSSDILSFEEIGTDKDRTVWWNQENTLTRILTNGSDLTFTEIDASNYAPPTSNEIIGLCSFLTGSGGGSQMDNKLHIRGKLSTITDSLTLLNVGSKITDFMNDHLVIRINGNQLFEYRVDSAQNQATIAVAAYLDDL